MIKTMPLASALALAIMLPSLGQAQSDVRPAEEIVPRLSGVAAVGGLPIQTAAMPGLAPALAPALAAPGVSASGISAPALAAPLALPAAAAEPVLPAALPVAKSLAPEASASDEKAVPGEPLAQAVDRAVAPVNSAFPDPLAHEAVAAVGRHVSDGSTSALFTGDTRGATDLAPLEAPLSKDPQWDSTLRAALISLGLNDRVTADRLRRSSDLFAAAMAEQRGAPLPRAEAVPAPSASRDVGTKEFFVLNALGVVGSIAAGIVSHHVLLGLLGTYVAAIPLLYGYVAFLRFRGDRINWPGIRFSPRVIWAGKSYPLLHR